MTTAELRNLINTEGRRHALVIYFTKKDGSSRRMVCRCYGHGSRTWETMTLWDMEKGALRCLNLLTVDRIVIADGRTFYGPAAPEHITAWGRGLDDPDYKARVQAMF